MVKRTYTNLNINAHCCYNTLRWLVLFSWCSIVVVTGSFRYNRRYDAFDENVYRSESESESDLWGSGPPLPLPLSIVHFQLDSPDATIPQSEWIALKSIYQATGGDRWQYYGTGARWNFTSLSANPCFEKWEGVLCTCSQTPPITIYKDFYPYYQYYDRKNAIGTIPSEIGSFKNLTHLHLRHNSIRGSLPDSISRLSNLEVFTLFSNIMTGPLPDGISRLVNLRALSLSNNSFGGTLPASISTLRKLNYLWLFCNSLSGSLPSSWSTLSELAALSVFSNQIVSSLPESWSTFAKLQTLEVFNNSLTGTLPVRWSRMTSLLELTASFNCLKGALPSQWSNMRRLQALVLAENFFTGILPYQWSTLQRLENFTVFSNSLSRSIPPQWGSFLTKLQLFDVSENHLTGPIPNSFVFATSLRFLLLSKNLLTGVIPVSLFQLPQLREAAFSLNCFSIVSISDNGICAAHNMTVLLLDGIHSASKCGNRDLFPSTSFGFGKSDTYTLPDSAASHVLPQCILSMPSLQTLHISGAGLIGNLSTSGAGNALLSPNLTDLILSHNYLTGSIVSAIQARKFWNRLDLSFNLFSGTLIPDISFHNEIVLDFSNNLLSGGLPLGLIPLKNVSVLQGNQFNCPLFSAISTLPPNDPFESKYICGSSNFSIALLFFAVLFFFFIAVFASANYCFGCLDKWSIKASKTFMSESEADAKPIQSLEATLRSISYAMVSSIGVVSVLMLVYGLFKRFNYTNVSDQEAYVVSVVQLEGYTPAAVVAVFYLAILFYCYRALSYHVRMLTNDVTALTRTSSFSEARTMAFKFMKSMRPMTEPFSLSNIRRLATFAVIFVTNAAVVSVINGAYVTVYFSYSAAFTRLISFALSLFKLIWTRVGLPYLLSFVKNDGVLKGCRHITFFSVLVVLNTVIIPCLSIIVVSPDCARYVFQTPPPISSTVSYCEYYNGFTVNGNYSSNDMCAYRRVAAATYSPPFVYFFQCSFALLNGYVGVFTYAFALIAFANPIRIMIFSSLIRILAPDSWMFAIVSDLLPQYCLPVQHLGREKTWAKVRKWFSQRHKLVPMRNTVIVVRSESVSSSVGIELPVVVASPVHNPISALHSEIEDPDQFVPVPDKISSGSQVPSSEGVLPITVDGETQMSDSDAESVVIFRSRSLVVQNVELLAVIFSFGLIFPPLCILGGVAVIIHNFFTIFTLRRFVLAAASHNRRGVLTIPLNHYLKVLEDECDGFSAEWWRCLPVPFISAYIIVAFYLFEIVGVGYPYQVSYTILLPILFLVLAQISWLAVGIGENFCKRQAP